MAMPLSPPLTKAETRVASVLHDWDCDHLGVADCEIRARRMVAAYPVLRESWVGVSTGRPATVNAIAGPTTAMPRGVR